MSATFGQTSDFLSEADLLRFRGLTNLLRVTNSIDDRGQQGGLGFIHHNAKREGNVLYRRLAEFGSLLVRHLEVVAVRSADKNGTLVHILTDPDRDDDETSDDSPELDDECNAGIGHVYYTKNSDPETDKNSGHRKKGMENGVAPLLVEIIPIPAEPMYSAGAWLLKHTIGTKRKAPKTTITLDKHGAMLMSLITATHEAVLPRDARRASTRIHNYVLLASIAKIRGRIIRGTAQHGRNIWDILVKQSTDVYAAHGNEKHLIEFMPRDAEGMEIGQNLMKTILESCKKSKTGLTPDLESLLEQSQTEDFLYTEDTRPIFQGVLSCLLLAVDDALLDLVNKKHELLMEKGKNRLSAERVQDAAAELDKYAQIASKWTMLLANVLQVAKTIMKAHLWYLKATFAIVDVKYGEKERREHNTSPSSYLPDATASDGLGQPSSEPGQYKSSTYSSSDNGLQDLESGLRKSVISGKGAYAAEFDEIDSAGLQQHWDLAALKYLDLICLHQKSLNSLIKGASGDAHDRRVHSFLKATRVEYLRCFQDQVDGNMMSMKRVMETLKFPGGSDVGPEDIEKIKGFIQEHELTKDGRPLISDTKWEDEKDFSGNFHCETLMLSLQLLHKTLAARDEISSDKNSTISYLQLPPRSIVDSFAKPAKVLPVSKRCCPACHALMEFVNDNTKEQIIYPGYHGNWFTAALPPWLPRNAGMAVIKAAELKLARRVLAYVKSNTPLSVSSTGTSHITTFREFPFGPAIPKSGIEYDSDSSSDRG